jgi:hypothetical protein
MQTSSDNSDSCECAYCNASAISPAQAVRDLRIKADLFIAGLVGDIENDLYARGYNRAIVEHVIESVKKSYNERNN